MRRALKPDAQAFDEIRIITVPRFKDSELSGSEWRISARVELWRKGKRILEDQFGNVKAAVTCLGAIYLRALDDGNGCFVGEDDLCDQEGCSEQATVFYRVINKYCNEPYIHKGTPPDNPEYRAFCERHSVRGDSSFDDSDKNYERMEKPENEK